MGRIGQNNLKSLTNKDKLCGETLDIVWTNSTHEFKLITLLPLQKFPLNSTAIGSMTLEVVLTNSAHEFKAKELSA